MSSRRSAFSRYDPFARDLAGESLLRVVGAHVWAEPPLAGSTPLLAGLRGAAMTADARRTVAESALPIAAGRGMALAVSSEHLLFWEKTRHRRELRLLGKVRLEEVSSVYGVPGTIRLQVWLAVSSLLLGFLAIPALENLDRWIGGAGMLCALGLAGLSAAQADFRGNTLYVAVQGRAVRLNLGMRDDPLAFVAAFEGARAARTQPG